MRLDVLAGNNSHCKSGDSSGCCTGGGDHRESGLVYCNKLSKDKCGRLRVLSIQRVGLDETAAENMITSCRDFSNHDIVKGVRLSTLRHRHQRWSDFRIGHSSTGEISIRIQAVVSQHPR